MKIIIFLLTLWAFIRTISYGIFEINQHKNKPGGITVIVISVISFILPNVMMYLR